MRKYPFLLAIFLFIVPFAAAYGVTFYNPSWNPQYGMVFEVVEPDTPYVMEVKNPDIAITKITFVIDHEVKSGGITVYNLKSVPDFLPEVAENTSFEYDEVKYSGFVPHDTKEFIYDFKVAKSWLEEMSVPRNSIALHAYDSKLDVWEVLPTEVVSDDDEFVYFNAADDEGVHYLFIGKSVEGTDAESLIPKEEVEGVEETEVEGSGTAGEAAGEPLDMGSEVTPVNLGESPVQPQAEPSAQPPSKPAPQPEDVSDSGMSGRIILLIVMALVVLIIILYLMFGRKRMASSVDKELHSYIDESLKRGKTKDEVRDRLLGVGWHHERVSKALAKHNDVKKDNSVKGRERVVDEPVENLSMAEAKALAERQRRYISDTKKHSKPSKTHHTSKKK